MATASLLLFLINSAGTMREERVASLTFHPYGVDGTPLLEYVAVTWEEYLQRWHNMAHTVTT